MKTTCTIFIGLWLSAGLRLLSPENITVQHVDQITNKLTIADSLFREQKTNQAKKIYKEILEIDEHVIAALAGLGKIAVVKEDWGEAKDRFSDVLQRDPENMEAYFYRAICYRETGKHKALLLRKLDWDRSNRYFKWVIERDSSFSDVLYQYAIFLRYREKYEDAVQACHDQIRLRPDLAQPRLKIYRFYRYLITHRDQQQAIEWLQNQHDEIARYFIGELYRRIENYNKADSVFHALRNRSELLSKTAIYLSLAKVHYAQKNLETGQSCFYRALNSINNRLDADLVFEDFKYVLSDSELYVYRAAESVDQRTRFFRAILNQRNPLPATKLDVRLAEHYRRLRYAEQYFEYDGFRTNFNNPDRLGYLKFTEVFRLNEEYNDKGLIYIRHGEPDDKAITADPDVPFNESWKYYGGSLYPEMTFHFLLENSTSAWRLAPVVAHPKMLADRLIWGNIYHKLLHASSLEYLTYSNEMAEQSRAAVEKGLRTDRHSWDNELRQLDFPFYLTQYRGKDDKTLLEIYYNIPGTTIAKEEAFQDSALVFDSGYSLMNLHWETVSSKNEQRWLPIKPDTQFLGVFRCLVEPDSYHVALHLMQEKTNYVGGYKFPTRVESFSGTDLIISDIILARRIQPSTEFDPFVKQGLSVVPQVSRQFKRKEPMYLYFEVYNLEKDAAGNTDFLIEYTLTLLETKRSGLQRFIDLFRGSGQSAVTVRSERTGGAGFSVEYMSLNVSKYDPGKYELKVNVTDRVCGRTFQRKQTLELF